MSFSSSKSILSLHYKCSCGEFCDISLLYFCQLCNKFNCSYCVTQQIDQYFCRNCMETSVWTDIRKHKFLCKNCYTCPRCFHTLNTVTISNQKNIEDYQVLYSLLCLHCRWSTRESGLQDCSLLNDFLFSNLKWIHFTKSLIDMYKKKMEQEIFENVGATFDSQSYVSNRYILDYRLKTSTLTHSFIKSGQKNTSTTKFSATSINNVQHPTQDISCTENAQLPDGIDNSFYSENFLSNESTSLSQRLNQTIFQCVLISDLKPTRLKIYSKRFKRCRYCQHILCRPDLNVSAIRFKILHIATLFVPIVRVIPCSTIEFGRVFKLPFVIFNPLLDGITIQINPNESLSKVKFETPSGNIELVGREEDHNLEQKFPQNDQSDRLISSFSGHSVQVFFKVSPIVSNFTQLHFSIVYTLTKTQDQHATLPKPQIIQSDAIYTSLYLRITW